MIDVAAKVLVVWILASAFVLLQWVAFVELFRVWFHWRHVRRERRRGGFVGLYEKRERL